MNRSTLRLLITCALPVALAVLVGGRLWNRFQRQTPASIPVVSGAVLPAGRVEPQIALGWFAGVLIAPDGGMWTWGYLPGLSPAAPWVPGAPADVPQPIAPGTNWVRAASGDQHFVMIRDDGTLFGMGANFFGELGQPSGGVSNLVQMSDETDWIDVAIAQSLTLALKRDGSLWTCGPGLSLAMGTPPPPPTSRALLAPLPGGHRWKAIAGGLQSAYALREDGSLWAWGIFNGAARPAQVGTSRDWHSIDAWWQTLVALKTNGTLWAGGIGGLPAVTSKSGVLEPVPGSDRATWNRTVALNGGLIARATDGSWWGMGANDTGQLGLGNVRMRRQLTRLPWPSEVVAMNAGGNSVVALFGDGSLWYTGVRPHNPIHPRPQGPPAREVHELLQGIGRGLGMPGTHGSKSAGEQTFSPVKLWTWPAASNGGAVATNQPIPP